jgi:hypothetical protein
VAVRALSSNSDPDSLRRAGNEARQERRFHDIGSATLLIKPAKKTIGIGCVLVHAIDDQPVKFWRDNEFIESPIGSRTFFLPIETIIDGLND